MEQDLRRYRRNSHSPERRTAGIVQCPAGFTCARHTDAGQLRSEKSVQAPAPLVTHQAHARPAHYSSPPLRAAGCDWTYLHLQRVHRSNRPDCRLSPACTCVAAPPKRIGTPHVAGPLFVLSQSNLWIEYFYRYERVCHRTVTKLSVDIAAPTVGVTVSRLRTVEVRTGGNAPKVLTCKYTRINNRYWRA